MLAPRLILLLLLGALAGRTWAQDSTSQARPDVRFRTPTIGLPHPEVQALAQDEDGLLWIGTGDGLSRFDGLHLLTLTHVAGDSTSLPSSRIRALLIARDGTLWVGTEAGLAALDVRTDAFRRWTSAQRGACAGGVAWLAEDAAGRILYGGTAQGVCRLDPARGQAESVELPWGQGAWTLRGLPDGTAWVLPPSDDGAITACLIEDAGGPCRAVDTGPFAPRLLGLDASRRLLAYGSQDGTATLQRWSRGRFIPVADGLPSFGWVDGADLEVVGREAWITTATSGLLAVGLEDGAWRWLAPQPGDPTSLPAHRVRSLLVDRQGAVWVGTSRGLALWRPSARPFTLYRRFTGRPGEISDDRVNGMTESRDGSLWVATNDGLNRLDPASDRFEVFRVPSSQDAGPPAWAPPRSDQYRDAWWQVLEGSDATLWVGSKRNGVFRLDRRTGLYRREVEVNRAIGLVDASGEPLGFGVRHLFEESDGHLWVGTTGEGLAVRHPDTGEWDAVRSGEDGLTHPNVNRFFEDAAGRLWLGTDDGLSRLALDDAAGTITIQPVDLGTGADGEAPVWSVAESAGAPGVLWVGTVGAGLARYDPSSGQTHRYTTADGLPSDLIYGVLSDDDGRIWASTSRGLVRLTPSTGALQVYDEDHGLQGDAFDLMAFYRSPTTGQMWFGGPNGLSRIDPAGAAVSEYHPPVAFTAVQVFDALRPGRPLSGDTLVFDHDENFLTVQFAALDLINPRALRYRYRLIGVDEGWRETTGERPVATYTDLAPGTYRLEVVGSNNDGVFNDEPAVLTLVVEPAWWQRAPVRALAVLLLAGLGVAGVLWLLHRAARRYRREQVVIADDLHEGPVQGLSRIGEGLDRIDASDGTGETLREVRARVGDVETGLHDALLRLQPSAVHRLGLRRSLDATLRRFRRAAPRVALVSECEEVGELSPEVQLSVVEVMTRLLSHTLRVTDAETVTVSLRREGETLRLRVANDGDVPVTAPALRDRLRGERSGLVRAASVVRQLGGALHVDRADGESYVEVRLPLGVAAEGPTVPAATRRG